MERRIRHWSCRAVREIWSKKKMNRLNLINYCMFIMNSNELPLETRNMASRSSDFLVTYPYNNF